MVAWLDPELVSVALCWKLERRDGVMLGFTNHDRDLTIDHLVYRAAPGLMPSAISLSEGFDVDGMELGGALSADAISENDLASGRWDGARVTVFAVDWRAPDTNRLSIMRGEIGDVALRDAGFTAELRGPAAMLEGPVVERTSPECRAELGDKRCRVDLAPRTHMCRVVAVLDDMRFAADPVWEDDALGYGTARWMSGPNSGVVRPVLRSSGPDVILRDAPPFPPAAGDLIELTEGCDKSFATCRGRFGNAANFRGEPHLPGMDLLTRYPGA